MNEQLNTEMQIAKNEHLQMMPIDQAKGWYNDFVNFSKSILKPELDFGVIPGTPKPSLYKPGAEKLRFVYGLGVEFECIENVVDIDRPFIDYSYRCSVKSKTGQILSQCEGNCNSLEPKFGYLWKSINELPEGTDISNLPSKTTGKKSLEFGFAIEKAETTGQYGKPKEYWDMWADAVNSGKAKKIIKKSKAGRELDAWEMDTSVTVYRILNPDVVGVKNTIMKMAQKRAFVGAILLATGASEFFTQDIEDMEINGAIYSEKEPQHPFTDVEIIEETPAPVYPKETKRKNSIGRKSTEPTEDEKEIIYQWLDKINGCISIAELQKVFAEGKGIINSTPSLYAAKEKKKLELTTQPAA